MTINVGDRLPDVTLHEMTGDGPQARTAQELFSGKKVVLFALPGAFTPTCSSKHVPDFVQRAPELAAKGVDSIVCLSVNDAFVMGAWGADRKVGDAVRMIADGSADFTKAVGLEMDGSNFGMGIRSQRYAAVIEDGVVTHLAVEAPMKFEV